MPRKPNVFIVAWSLLLVSCASAPNVCPNLPERPVKGQPAPNFQDLMEDFLRGTLPKLPESQMNSLNVTPGSTK